MREILGRLRDIANKLGTSVVQQVGIKQVDEIEFFGGNVFSVRREMLNLQNYWRDELASALGVENLRSTRGGSAVAVY